MAAGFVAKVFVSAQQTDEEIHRELREQQNRRRQADSDQDVDNEDDVLSVEHAPGGDGSTRAAVGREVRQLYETIATGAPSEQPRSGADAFHLPVARVEDVRGSLSDASGVAQSAPLLDPLEAARRVSASLLPLRADERRRIRSDPGLAVAASASVPSPHLLSLTELGRPQPPSAPPVLPSVRYAPAPPADALDPLVALRRRQAQQRENQRRSGAATDAAAAVRLAGARRAAADSDGALPARRVRFREDLFAAEAVQQEAEPVSDGGAGSDRPAMARGSRSAADSDEGRPDGQYCESCSQWHREALAVHRRSTLHQFHVQAAAAAAGGDGAARPLYFVPPDSIGYRLMRGRMGWTGGGLGAHEQGPTAPVATRVKNDRLGIGMRPRNPLAVTHSTAQRAAATAEQRSTHAVDFPVGERPAPLDSLAVAGRRAQLRRVARERRRDRALHRLVYGE